MRVRSHDDDTDKASFTVDLYRHGSLGQYSCEASVAGIIGAAREAGLSIDESMLRGIDFDPPHDDTCVFGDDDRTDASIKYRLARKISSIEHMKVLDNGSVAERTALFNYRGDKYCFRGHKKSRLKGGSKYYCAECDAGRRSDK